jgi:putative endonuclease
MIGLLNFSGMDRTMSPDKARRQKAYNKGRSAEDEAAGLLARRGYQVLSRRYRSPAGEIDLIASDGRRLAFVEVKARRELDDAAWAVTPRQQRRIADAASHWLQAFPQFQSWDMSFDAVLIASRERCEYIPDAFQV